MYFSLTYMPETAMELVDIGCVFLCCVPDGGKVKIFMHVLNMVDVDPILQREASKHGCNDGAHGGSKVLVSAQLIDHAVQVMEVVV